MSNHLSIFDTTFGSTARGTMYQAWAAPDLYPDEPQPVLSNWHPEDLVAYVGGPYIQKEN